MNIVNPTLTDVVISCVAYGLVVAALVVFIRWVNRPPKDGATREPEAGPEAGQDIPLPYTSSLDGAPVHAHIVYWPTESQQHKRRLPVACPLCLNETWKQPGSHIPEHYPRYIPVLCDRHTPTIITPVVRLPQPQHQEAQ